MCDYLVLWIVLCASTHVLGVRAVRVPGSRGAAQAEAFRCRQALDRSVGGRCFRARRIALAWEDCVFGRDCRS